jgi:hypothetical protein
MGMQETRPGHKFPRSPHSKQTTKFYLTTYKILLNAMITSINLQFPHPLKYSGSRHTNMTPSLLILASLISLLIGTIATKFPFSPSGRAATRIPESPGSVKYIGTKHSFPSF